MPPGRYDFTIRRGDTCEWTFTIHEGDEDSPIVDLTGASARLQIRQTPDATDAILTLTDSDGITLGAAQEDHGLVLIPAATTRDFDFDSPAYYDLEITYAGGNVATELDGYVGLDADVTRGA